MEVENPRLLWLLLLLVPLTVVWLASHARGKRALVAIGGEWRRERLVAVYVFKRFFSHLFFCCCIASALLAVAGPRWGTRLVSDERVGFEFIFVVDLSQSMLAGDATPSRLEWSRRAMSQLIEVFAHAEIGIVGFRGGAVKLVPVTEDHFALKTAVQVMDPGYVTTPGSGIGEGLRVALEGFTGGEGKYRAVFLFTDGEAREAGGSSGYGEAAVQLGRRGVPVIALAVGTEEGAEIPVSGGGVLTDSGGVTVVTRREMAVLQSIAEATGGQVFRAEEGVPRASRLESFFRRGEIEGEEGLRLEMRDRFGFVLVVAAILLAVSTLFRVVRWRDVY